MKFSDNAGSPLYFPTPFPIVCVTFRSEDIRHYVSESSKNRTNVKVFWPPLFVGETRLRLFYGSLLGRLTTHYLAKFGKVPFADVRLRSLAMKWDAEFR